MTAPFETKPGKIYEGTFAHFGMTMPPWGIWMRQTGYSYTGLRNGEVVVIRGGSISREYRNNPLIRMRYRLFLYWYW